jgi:hypothetical protein
MSTTSISPAIDVRETSDGVRYVLHTSNNDRSNFSLFLAMVVRVPVLAAALAVWFLWEHFQQVSILLVAASALFVLQMVYITRLPWNPFRRRLWQQLIDRFGHGEIELQGDRLCLGSRVGAFWSGKRRSVARFRRIVVYTYRPEMVAPTEEAGTHSPETERSVLAIETNEEKPWLLVDGFSRDETVALAEDLHRRLSTAAVRDSSTTILAAPVVVETGQNVLYPPLDAGFYQRRKPWWLVAHIAGAIGLGALTAIALQVGAWNNSGTKAAIILGWLLEILILGTTFSLPKPSGSDEQCAR